MRTDGLAEEGVFARVGARFCLGLEEEEGEGVKEELVECNSLPRKGGRG